MNKILAAIILAVFQFSGIQAADPSASTSLSDDELLEAISRESFKYFWNEVNPKTGLAYDSMTNRNVSNASVGFSLASLCVADYRKWITHQQAYDRVLLILNSAYDDPSDPNDFYLDHVKGHAYHWTNAESGKWSGAEGICTHDTIAYLCGILTVRKYFEGTEIEKLADKILDQVDWNWLAERSKDKKIISNLYSPNNHDWGGVLEYDGMKLDYLLPIGASKNTMSAHYWDNWADTYQWKSYKGKFRHIARSALWIHQWDNCFVDLQYLTDTYADYFQNSVVATLANRQWCIDNKMVDENAWGLNPTDGFKENGEPTYGDYGAPPAPNGSWQQGHVQDGTIAFTAAIPSVIFTPKESIAVARFMWNNLKSKMWKKYGFTCSFNLRTNRFSENYIGIDLGPVIINIENYRSGLIWKTFMKNEIVQQGLDRSGFVGIIDNFDGMEFSAPYAKWSFKAGQKIKLGKHPEIAKDGNHSMQVAYSINPGERLALTVEPKLKNYSRYDYLGIWTKGDDRNVLSKVALTNQGGKEIICPPYKHVRNGGWRIHYFVLPKRKADIESVKELSMEFLPKKVTGTFYIDRVHVTNVPVTNPPSPIKELKIEQGQSTGEMTLKWKQPEANSNSGQGRIVRHVAAYSSVPIQTERDFQQAKKVPEKEMKKGADRKEWECSVDNLSPGKKYHFSVRAQDVAGLLSVDLSTAHAQVQAGSKSGMGPGIVDNFESAADWKTVLGDGSQLSIGNGSGQKGNGLKLQFDSGSKKSFVVAYKNFSFKLPERYKFKFFLKGNSPKNNLEFKLIDKNGSTFWKKWENLQFPGQWTEMVASNEDIVYAWGPSESMGRIEKIEFAVSAGSGGSGTVEIDELRLEY